jgi:very-short-patch-repair endonuclease/DNA polymerase III delta prime subunit
MIPNREQTSGLVGERFTKLFEFLKAFSDLQYPLIRNIDQQLRTLWLGDFSGHSGVELYRDEPKEPGTATDSTIVFRVARPNLTPCPPPPDNLAEWIKAGWQKIDSRIEIQTSRKRLGRLEDDFQRLEALSRWTYERDQWVKSERPVRRAAELFQNVYEWFGMLEREGERVELLLGDGLLCWQHEADEFKHPVLLQKLELEFHPEKREPEFIFRKRELPPELYREFLHALPGNNSQQIIQCDAELKAAEFSPLSGRDTQDFLRRLIQGLFPAGGEFCEPRQKPSGTGPYVERRPVIFMRQRRSGPANVFDLVLESIGQRLETGEPFSSALMQILGLIDLPPKVAEAAPATPAATPAAASAPPASGPESTATAGNEDAEILLSKPANGEQLQIARDLAHRDCVLVQGPPGTGKTHTIANLLGHLLAQGKRVLVTAHTPKALRILREKVVEPLQPLCVSVLQNDKKSHEELQQSVRQIHIRLSQDDKVLEREAARLRDERHAVVRELQATRQRLLEGRQEEIREVVIAGKTFGLIEASKLVRAGQGKDDWIPGPTTAGQALPLTHDEIFALYQSNARILAADERDLNITRPELALFPSPEDFQSVVEEKQWLTTQDLRFGAQFWRTSNTPPDLSAFARMMESAGKAIEFFKDSAAWQLEAIQAGRDGEPSRRTWDALADYIEESWAEIHECHALVMEHGPSLSDPRPARVLLPLVDEMLEHIAEGGRLNLLTRLTKPQWVAFTQSIRINGAAPDLTRPGPLRAVRAQLRIAVLREELAGRWERMMTSGDAPTFAELGDRPEEACRGFVGQIRACLEWHKKSWQPLEEQFGQLGFQWPTYLASTVPEVGNDAELRRLRSAVVGDLVRILQCRTDSLRLGHLQAQIEAWQKLAPERSENEAVATRRLREAMAMLNADGYRAAFDDLARLKILEPEQRQRNQWLSSLATGAPAWAAVIQNRQAPHDQTQPPGDPAAAWQWRQLYDELERRAAVGLEHLQESLEKLSHRLLKLTTELVEKQTWCHQVRTVTTAQKQALGAYVALRNRVTKSGTGKKDSEFRAAARREIAVAKSAVPVWIMPLSEVAETFDPRSTRFDVVIIDEASQCDPSAMFALYLGRQAVIVGDDEQVTPITVGVEAEAVMKLIHGYLDGVPRRELYDGQTSVYEFGQWAFGKVIRLVEHFRCASDIIAFSNNLSYRGEIKPLREENAVKLKPHVIPYQVKPHLFDDRDVNHAEAEAIASLICAAIKQPEYAVNEQGTPVTFGVVTLVGDKQALLVDDLLRQRLPAEEYQLRQILCGSPSHLQGDERDVVFLSVVDTPADGPLPLRDPDAQMRMFKRRFNVAASRARDQMWVVHSLDPHADLKAGDIRRQLIEHALDPKAWSRELEKRRPSLDPDAEAFEGTVMRRLVERGFQVQAQVSVGTYRIGLVVVGGNRRLAVECDGENIKDLERLHENMERQAILERLGWRFVRVRGSLFFRDPDRALAPVFRRLEELGIQPESAAHAATPVQDRSKLETRVMRQAEELRLTWSQELEPGTPAARTKNEATLLEVH